MELHNLNKRYFIKEFIIRIFNPRVRQMMIMNVCNDNVDVKNIF